MSTYSPTVYLDKCLDLTKVIQLTEKDENGLWKRPPKTDDQYYWSGKLPIPEIGSEVFIYMNDLGLGNVIGYGVLYGYLYLRVKLNEETRPHWHRLQNKDIDYADVFGIDIHP